MARVFCPWSRLLAAGMLMGGCATQPMATRQAPVPLTTANVKIIGPNARIANTPREEYLGYWTATDTYAQWTAKDLQAGTYEVEVLYSLDVPYAGSTIAFSAAGQTLTAKFAATKNWDDYQLLDLGKIKAATPGDLAVTIKATAKPQQYVMNLQKVILTPVK